MTTYTIQNDDGPAGDQLAGYTTYVSDSLHTQARAEIGRSFDSAATDTTGLKADYLSHCTAKVKAAATAAGLDPAKASCVVDSSQSNGQGGWDDDTSRYYAHPKYDGGFVARTDEGTSVVYANISISVTV